MGQDDKTLLRQGHWGGLLDPAEKGRLYEFLDGICTVPLPAAIEYEIPLQTGCVRRLRDTVVHALQEGGSTYVYGFLEDAAQCQGRREADVRAAKALLTVELLPGVVHDLKNMLAGASGLTMLLLRKSDDDAFSSDLRKISERISNAGELATTLSRFILPAGRKGCGNDIGAIVERAIALTACPLRSSGMKTHARLDDELPQVHCGGEDLLFVFVSLFLTTARMMAGAGSSGSLTVSSGTADGHVQVRFSCEPVTISERELADLSGPAIPAWPQYGSYGFNLETAREVLHGMGGELRVSNDEAAVLTFTVELPSASSSEQRLRSVKKG